MTSKFKQNKPERLKCLQIYGYHNEKTQHVTFSYISTVQHVLLQLWLPKNTHFAEDVGPHLKPFHWLLYSFKVNVVSPLYTIIILKCDSCPIKYPIYVLWTMAGNVLEESSYKARKNSSYAQRPGFWRQFKSDTFSFYIRNIAFWGREQPRKDTT